MTRTARRKRREVKVVLPPDAPPLREVVVQLAAKSRQLNELDDQIWRALGAIEQRLRDRRPDGHPVDVPFPPWGKLAWSGRHRRWRLVVVDEEECEDLAKMPRSCRAQACLVLPKLIDRLGVVPAR